MRSCPICASYSRTQVWQTVVACSFCGMVYDQREQEMDYVTHDAYALAEPDAKRTEQTMFLLAPLVHGRVLEVGCANGDLLERLARVASHVKGVEPSIKAREVCHAKGLDVSAQLPDGQFSLVVLSHVLEHLSDPAGMLRALRNRLEPDGVLYIEVPDATRHLDHLTIPYQEFSDAHVSHFSPVLLENLLRQCGLEVSVSGTRTTKFSDTDAYPAMWMMTRRMPAETLYTCDEVLPRLMRRYAEESERLMQEIAARVRKRLEGARFTAWGAGVFAQHLLPMLDGVHEIVDRNRLLHGREMAGVKVTAPPPQDSLPILIASLGNEASILKDIKKLGLTNEVISCRT